MNINFKNTDKINTFGIILGIGGLIFAGWQAKKTSEITGKLGLAMQDIENHTTVEIQDEIVHNAVEKAANREVQKSIAAAVNDVKQSMKDRVNTEVRKEVNESLETIREKVAGKISDQVATIDEGALQKKVTEQAEKKILEKFDGSLDGVLNEARSECRRRLNDMTKSWEGIADWAQTLLPRRTNNGMSFRIGD